MKTEHLYPSQTDEREPPNLPRPEWVYISPEMAASLTSGNNRPVKTSVVKEYRRLMEAGLWRLSPHGITLDEDGEAADGNHRMHALAGAKIKGLWFLVCDWRIHASELRVDRGSARTMGDFCGMSSFDVSPLTLIASLIGAGGSNRRDPSEMAPIVKAFMGHQDYLQSSCGSRKRGRSTAPVRAAIVIRMSQLSDHCRSDLASQYRLFVHGEQCMWPSFFSLGRQIDTMSLSPWEILERTYRACCDPTITKIQIRSSILGDIRSIARAAIDEAASQLPTYAP